MLHFLFIILAIVGSICVLSFVILISCIVYIIISGIKIHKQLKDEAFFD
jgi:hypothetical protein